MKNDSLKLIGLAGILLAGTRVASAQGSWDFECIDPTNMTPKTTDYVVSGPNNELIGVGLGESGTVTYGGGDATARCWTQATGGAKTIQAAGKFCFYVGPQGSVQQTSPRFSDGGLDLNLGAPFSACWSYANLSVNGALNYIGQGGFPEYFNGLSNRYLQAITVVQGVQVKLQIEVVADAARMRWTLTNTTAATIPGVGLLFGSNISMATSNPAGNFSNPESGRAGISSRSVPAPTRSEIDLGANEKEAYILINGQRPPDADTLYDRLADASTFPDSVNFLFGQTDGFGMRVDNGPTPATEDIPANEPTQADRFWLGKDTFLLGDVAAANPTFPLAQLPDTPFLNVAAFVQRFPEQQMLAGETRQILHYVRSPWGAGDYKLPFGAVVDAPQVVNVADTQPDGKTPSIGGLSPNPFNIRVDIDNVGGFAFDQKEFPLQDVRVILDFGSAASGISITGAAPQTNYTSQKTIPNIDPRALAFVDFQATANADVSGNVPFTVTIKAEPGNVTKVISSTLKVASRPRLTLQPEANLITSPFTYTDSSWTAVLSNFLDPNVPGAQVISYAWDAAQNGYVPSTSVQRGLGAWVVYNKTNNSKVTADLSSNPSMPQGFLESAPLVQIKSGWNLIADPYNYQFPMGQILGVSASSAQISHTFGELIQLGFISSFLSYWDPVAKDYVFVDGQSGTMVPNVGYWIQNLTTDDITLNYPAVFDPGVQGQFRVGGVKQTPRVFQPIPPAKPWQQTDKQWRLKLVARTDKEIDAENYVGAASSATNEKQLRMYKPPTALGKSLGVVIQGEVNGKSVPLAQDLRSKAGKNTWNVLVTASDVKVKGLAATTWPKTVNLTWPNISTVPKNQRFRITDVSTGVSREMRQSSGYSFTMTKAGARQFTITAEPATGVSSAVITNVMVSSSGARVGGPMTIAYTLSSDATTSVRILSASGREINTIRNARADTAGQNSVVWNMRNSANQAVAPGVYRVEIVAETPTGERVRKVLPINVIR